MDKQTMQQAVRLFGTPTFVFDETALEQRMKAIKAIVGPNVHLCYSIKANPFLTAQMTALTEALEVCSPGEMEICNRLGVNPALVIFSGVNKTEADVERAVSLGVRRFTAESLRHVDIINGAALRHGLKLQVLLRLTAGSQFGMDEADVRSTIARREQLQGMEIEGIHFFAGTQRKKTSVPQRELQRLSAFVDDLKETLDFTVRKIEYGPGLYYPYFANEDRSDTLAPLREIQADLECLSRKAELTVEMGRFFVSECGTYLTKVVDTKQNLGSSYAIVDGGIHHVNYLGGNMGLRLPMIEVLQAEKTAGEEKDWILCGSLCTTADVLVRAFPACALSVGDCLAFQNIGAYSVTEGPNLFLSRDMPKVVICTQDGFRLIREVIHTYELNCPET